MSGKGKRRGKDKNKSKKHEDKWDGRGVDAVCFAYDVFKYSVSKFGVKDQCLAAWEGSPNNYGRPETFISICRTIISRQLLLRHECYTCFMNHYEPNKLESFELVGKFWKTCFEEIANKQTPTHHTRVELSLSVACELLLFVYTETEIVYLKQLAEYWFEAYFLEAKEEFENEGGLDKTRYKGDELIRQYPHGFIDLWIDNKYSDYKKSALDKGLLEKYFNSALTRKAKNQGYAFNTWASELKMLGNIFASLSERDEVSGVGVPPHPALGVPLPQDMYNFPLASDAALSQNLPGASDRDLSKHHTKGSSCQERRRRKPSLLSNVEQGLGELSLDSSVTKQSREENPSVSITTDTTQSCGFLRDRSKGPVLYKFIPDSQAGESGPSSRAGKVLGQTTLAIERKRKILSKMRDLDKRSEKSEDMAADDRTSQSLPGVSCQESEKEYRESGSSSRAEQDLGPSTLATTETKLPTEEKALPSVVKLSDKHLERRRRILSKIISDYYKKIEKKSEDMTADDKTSQSLPGASLQLSEKEYSGSSSEVEIEEKEIQEE